MTSSPAGLKQAVAIVTGGGQGLGKGIAERLTADGAQVVIFDRNAATAHAVAAELTHAGRLAVAIECDVTDRTALSAQVAAVVQRFKRIDILVNNAGWGTGGVSLLEMPPEVWHKLIDVNLIGVINCTAAVLPQMMTQRYGRIVCVTSDAGRVGTERQSILAAAKAGAMGFSRSLAFELAEYGITINCVSPGSVDTPLSKQGSAGRSLDERVRAIPMKRLGAPEDIANAVAFFVTPQAGYITGQVLSVNGGKNRVG